MSSDQRLRVSRVLHGTTAEGPGLRSAIWVQGCSIRCRGCINPHLFTTAGGNLVNPDLVVDDAVRAGVEGLTLLGGEPFDQKLACSRLASLARSKGLGVICFTGYLHETLQGDPEAQGLLEQVDLLVDGPYLADAPEGRRSLVGSTNQRFLHLTGRYADYQPETTPNRIEVRISMSGAVEVAGFLSQQRLDQVTASTKTSRHLQRRPT